MASQQPQRTEYDDFVISFGPADDNGHPIDVESPAGSCSARLQLPFCGDELAQLTRATSKPRHPERDVVLAGARPVPKPDRRKLGRCLFDALFKGRVRDLFLESRAMARQRRRGLRLRLRFDPEQPGLLALAALPWELMYADPGGHIALSRHTPILREPRVAQPSATQPAVDRLKVLVVLAMPDDQQPLQLQRERQTLEEIWRDHPTVDLECLSNPNLDALCERLDEGAFHVLHFMGHGGATSDGKGWMLCFVGSDGNTEKVPASELAEELADFSDSLRLVVLNACQTGRPDSAVDGGVALQLVSAGCTAVVAMRESISDTAAIELSKALYHRLAAGDPVERALTVARKRLRRQEWLGSVGKGEWAVPVLLLRTADGALFDAAAENAAQSEPKQWWPYNPLGLAALAAGSLGLALLLGLGSLWTWEPAPLRYAAGVITAVLLGLLGALVHSERRMVLSLLSNVVVKRRSLLAALLSLPLAALAGWWFLGLAKVDELRCSPLQPLSPGGQRVAVGSFQHATDHEAAWASEMPGLLVDRLRCLGDEVQVLRWPNGIPEEIPDCCVDVTISGNIRQDRDVVVEAFLKPPNQQAVPLVRRGQPDGLGFIDHLTGNLILDVVKRLGVEPTPEQRLCLQAPPTGNEEARGHNHRGVILLLRDRYKDAESAFHAALELDPDYSSALSNLALVLLRKEPPDLEEAVRRLRRAVARDPENPTYHFNLGLALESLGTALGSQRVDDPAARRALREAAAAYKTAIALDRNHALAHNNLGFTLVQLGRLEQAHEILLSGRRLAADPRQRAYFEKNLGLVAVRQADPRRAVVHLEEALELSPGLPEALFLLTQAQGQLLMRGEGSADELCNTLRDYLAVADLDPDSSHRQDADQRLQNLPCGE